MPGLRASGGMIFALKHTVCPELANRQRGQQYGRASGWLSGFPTNRTSELGRYAAGLTLRILPLELRVSWVRMLLDFP